MGRRVVVITGVPGCNLKPVVSSFQVLGYDLNWPNEDLSISPVAYCEGRGENASVREMHDSILHQSGVHWFTTRAPRYYDVPHPGPDGILDQFPKDQDVVFSDPLFCFFLPMWKGRYTDVVVCDWDEARILPKLRSLSKQDDRGCRAVLSHYRERLLENTAQDDVTILTPDEAIGGAPERIVSRFKNRFLD